MSVRHLLRSAWNTDRYQNQNSQNKKERSFTIVVISVHTPVLFSDTNLSDNNNMSDSATEGRDEVSFSNSYG